MSVVFLTTGGSMLAADKASYAEFVFEVPAAGGNEFARELFAQVSLPGNRSLVLPAFLLDARGHWAVRVRNDQQGTYALTSVVERSPQGETPLSLHNVSSAERALGAPATLRGFVRIDPRNPRKFAFENGEAYFPLGANCAWTEDADYRGIFAAYAKHALNWGRIWMAHWGLTNMEWLPGPARNSPKPGVYDLPTAKRWDAIVREAELHGVYFQLVFQHHGQLSTEVNSNWRQHPWNAANGGFLAKPGDFFRSEKARSLMRQKLRYAVARWGYSTSIMAWELFNEVMFTDAVRLERDEASVLAWHREMSDYLRSIDPYHHLITTSTDEVDSPVYACLDFVQPHRYCMDMVSSVIGFDAPVPADKPVFYGEAGDDHTPAKAADKQAGFTLDPITWASLCGGPLLPAQQWYHDRLLPTGRIASIGSAARFARFAGLERREDLNPFQAQVVCEQKLPRRFSPGFYWHKRKPAFVPVGDSDVFHPSQADIPHFMVGTPRLVAEGYTDRVSFDFDRSAPIKALVHFTECGSTGARALVLIDGAEVAHHIWKADKTARPRGKGLPAADISVEVPAGRHRMTVINEGQEAIRLGTVELDEKMNALACFGRRSPDFAVLFVWHRDAVFTRGGATAQGTVLLKDVPPGTWRMTWWNVEKAEPGMAWDMKHAGGLLEIATPPLARFVAGTLEKLP